MRSGSRLRMRHIRIAPSVMAKAVKHVEDVEKAGGKPAPAPRHPTEKKFFEKTAADESLKKEIENKHVHLIDNVGKITIKSTSPPERWTSTRELPTRETEFLHRNDPVWEYGFYEPELDKMPHGKLMFREALEMLRTMQEMNVEGTSEAAATMRETARNRLEEHSGFKRVGNEKLELAFQYFRPFERRDTQKIVSKADFAKLEDMLQGRSEQEGFLEAVNKINVKKLLENPQTKDLYDKLQEKEKREFEDAVKQLKTEQEERLSIRLGEINMMEEEFKKSFADAKAATTGKKSDKENKT